MVYPPISGTIVEIKLSENKTIKARYIKRTKNNLHFINFETKESFQMNIYEYNKKTLNPRNSRHPIRDKHRRKQRSKINNNQKNVCRFVKCNYLQFTVDFYKKNYHWHVYKNQPTKIELFALQIENKIYYVGEDNKLHYHFLNTKGANIIQVFDNIPDNTHPLLVKKFETFYSKNLIDWRFIWSVFFIAKHWFYFIVYTRNFNFTFYVIKMFVFKSIYA